MEFHAALSTQPDTQTAVGEVCAALKHGQADLAVVFVSHHHGPEFHHLLEKLHEELSPRNLIGCTGEGIIGPTQEVERAPGLAVWTAKLPGVRVLPFIVDQNDLERMDGPAAWVEHLGARPEDQPGIVILPEPYSFHTEACLEQLDAAYPASRIVGGVASGAQGPGQNRLFLADQVLRHGMVGVSLAGPLAIHTIVSQGCRPIGQPFVITQAAENIIYQLRGKPALEVLRDVFQEASASDKSLMQQGVLVGRLVDERLTEFRPSDFLIRNVAGVVEETALAVTALVRNGQTVQFHVRDAGTASEEMEKLLRGEVSSLPAPAHGGLVFSCNGRGSRLFGRSNHDIGLVNRLVPDCAVAGLFAAGEIGPIGHKTFIHGFTSSLILFREDTPK